MLRYSSSLQKPNRPSRIRFGLLSAEEIRKVSVVQVTETTLYYRGLPNSGGLLDPLMGSVNRLHLCALCMKDATTCEGHAGYIELSYPMYHTGFIEIVVKLLRSVCFACSRLCVQRDEVRVADDLTGKSKFTTVHTLAKAKRCCPHCEYPRPNFIRQPLGIKIEWPADVQWESEEERAFCQAPFTAREALSILTHIPDEDCCLLGFDPQFSHPRNMIQQVLVVPPPSTRPAIYASEQSRSRGQNDLTMKLLDCLKRSNELGAALNCHWKDFEGPFTPDILDKMAKLQFDIFSLINNNVRGCKPSSTRSGHTQKSLSCRLKGKEGRVRGNLCGKRVDFSARCVITPDPHFDCDRVGVPYSIAKTLTVPVTVNTLNIASLAARVRAGSDSIKGAQCVIHKDGTVVDLSHCSNRDSIALQLGDVVERNLDDDDVVIFNRQPSLHKHGMQAHRVRLMPGRTFRLNLVVAAPYNADFDGDEMNLHVPQSEGARIESALLLAVPQNIIGPQSNKPTMGIVQDSLLGMYKMTLPGTVVNHAHTCRMVGATMHVSRTLPSPCLRVRDRRTGALTSWWTGKQLFSSLLPESLFLEPERLDVSEIMNDDSQVVIRGGQLLCGTIRKAHVGTAAGGIVDVLTREYGGVRCCRFFNDGQRMTHAFLLIKGHEVGIHDVMLSSEGHRDVNERLHKAVTLCDEIQKEIDSENAPPDVAVAGERAILRLLSKTLMQTGGIVNEHMSTSNSIRMMVNAGSKGTFINLSQICASLGQQSLEGGRIKSDKSARTLPCFAPGDHSLASQGFVANSYALGLSPTDVFFHAIGGREGLVDTAVKTSQTGYLQRRMNKSFEDHLTHSDGSIQNALGEVISFKWGSDGMNPSHLERVKLPCLTEPVQRLRARMTPEEFECMHAAMVDVMAVKSHVLTTEIDTRVLLPFNLSRFRRRIQRERAEDPSASVDPELATQMALSLAKDRPSVITVAVMDICCRSSVEGMDAKRHAHMMETLKKRIETGVCCAGESVGSLAAQSTGEPCTQMTLNTFHFAGVSSKNVTLGLPRLKELLDASKAPKTPCTTIRLKTPYNTHKACAEYMANTMPLTRLNDLVTECDILFEPRLDGTTVDEDVDMVETDFILGTHEFLVDPSKYVVRIKLHREIMRTRLLTAPLVRTLLTERLGRKAHILSSESNSLNSIIRIRFNEVGQMVKHGNLLPDQESIICHRAAKALMDTVLISGHPDITSASMAESTMVFLDKHEMTLKSTEEYVIHLYGDLLADSAASSIVDWNRCTSNNVWETLYVLGIEACAHVLFDQIKAVISFDGQYVDDRHILLIVDSMCRGGKLSPLNRHGINRADTSPLMRASFEETIDVLCDAAIFAESENARGVTTSIMTGQLAEFGSGATDVMIHKSMLARKMVDDTLAEFPTRSRVLRSKCRSFVAEYFQSQTFEYVLTDAAPSMTSAGSQAARVAPDLKRTRFRFRSVSPLRRDAD